ncbi:hypothetical protein ACFLZW_04240 [Chloroflexota bacterium]
MQIQKLTKETKQVVALAKNNHWGFRVLGYGDVITSPVYHNQWWFVPAEQDDSTIPGRATNRVQAILDAGHKIQGVIVAHEAPKLLQDSRQANMDILTGQHVKDAVGVLVRVVTTAATFFGYLFAFGLLALVDPALIVVLEDGTWVEVMRWYE